MNKETISKIKHAFYSYLDEDQRISVKLQLCMSLVQPSSLFLPILQSILKKITQPLKLLRMLIFLHNCYIHHLLPASVVLVVLPLITKQSKPCKTFRLDLIIHKQVLPTYMLYLQKCYQSIQQSQCAEYELFMDPIQKIYRNINMLKLGLSFIDVIYTFGRYFQRDFGFAADFNITLAVDFTRLYQHKIKLVLKANRDLWDEGMKIELEKLHERMYIVYYNCYYYKHLIGLTPRFIQTEHPHQTASKSLIKLPQRQPPQQKTHSPNKKQSLNMSLSTAFSFNMSTKLKADPLNRNNYKNMSNSTVIGLTTATGSAIKNKYNLENVSKVDILKNNYSVLYADASQGCVVSQFTCDLSDKKEELVQDLDQSQGSQCQGDNHGDDDPFALLQCMEKVVAAMDNQTFNQQVKV